MKKLCIVLFVALGCLSCLASTITLIGDNSKPGFVTIQIDGQTYESIDYTGQRYAGQGQTWTANVFGFDELSTKAYYGPNDPQIRYPDYVTRYHEFNWLFNQMLTAPGAAVADIQEAIYYISDSNPGDGRFHPNVWAELAIAEVALGHAPDTSGFLYINSPFEKVEKTAYSYWDEKQGFMIQTPEPEPGLVILAGLGLLALGRYLRTRGQKLLTARQA